jgi:hypothetical protein
MRAILAGRPGLAAVTPALASAWALAAVARLTGTLNMLRPTGDCGH